MQHLLAAGYLLWLIVTAFHQDVRQYGRDQRCGCIVGKGNDPVDSCETGQYQHTIFERIDRARLALEPPHRLVVVHGNDQSVTEALRFFEIGHVTGMQDIEATVRHDDALPAGARLADKHQ